MVTPKTVRWPRILTPSHLAQLILQQKNPSDALHLFTTAPLLYPSTYRHTPAVLSALTRSLSPSPPHLPLLRHHLRLFLLHSPFPNLRRRRSPDIHAVNLLLRSLSSRPHLALSAFLQLPNLALSPDRATYRILMRSLCSSPHTLHHALHLLYSMLSRISQRGADADVVVFRTLLYALCDAGRVADAEDALGKVLLKGLRTPQKRRAFAKPELKGLDLEEMKSRIDELLVIGGVRSSRSYSAVLEDLYAEGKFGSAEKMFDEMIERGFRPKVGVYERKIEGLCRYGRVEDGVRVVEVEMEERGCVRSVRCYELAMEGLCGKGEARRAVGLLGRMEREVGLGVRKESFEIVVRGLLREGEVVEAARVLERMARRRFWAGRELYGEVVMGLCSVGRRYEAMVWFEEMMSQGKLPDVGLWGSVVDLVCGDWDAREVGVRLDVVRDDCI